MMQDFKTRYTITVYTTHQRINLTQGVLQHLGSHSIAFVPQPHGTVIVRPPQPDDDYQYTVSAKTLTVSVPRLLETVPIADGPWLVRLLPDHAVEMVRQPDPRILNQPHVDPSAERIWLTTDRVKDELQISDRMLRVYMEDGTIQATPLAQIAHPPKRIHGHTKFLIVRKELDRFLAIRREEYGLLP